MELTDLEAVTAAWQQIQQHTSWCPSISVVAVELHFLTQCSGYSTERLANTTVQVVGDAPVHITVTVV